MFSKKLGEKLDKFHLLQHPFYQVYWNEGKLTREIIRDYAEQYYQHVKAFPRYISATHSICEDLEKRRILLENLQDEENKDGDHPKLWKNFAKALGADEKEIEKVKLDWFTKDMIDNFFLKLENHMLKDLLHCIRMKGKFQKSLKLKFKD